VRLSSQWFFSSNGGSGAPLAWRAYASKTLASGNGKRLGIVWVGSALGSVVSSPNRRVSIHDARLEEERIATAASAIQ